MTKNDLLSRALENEKQAFEKHFNWLQRFMSSSFFKEANTDMVALIARNLIDFDLRQFFTTIRFKRFSITICLEEDDSDIKILNNYKNVGIKNYLSFISKTPLDGINKNLKIVFIYFTEAIETIEDPFPFDKKEQLKNILKKNESFDESAFDTLINSVNKRFLNALSIDLLVHAFNMFARAKKRDTCQYEVIFNENYKEKNIPSIQIVLAWKNTPKQGFLNRIAHIIFHNKLKLTKVNATYINPYEKDTLLIMALGIDGYDNKADFDATDIDEFIKELVTAKYFAYFDKIYDTFTKKNIINGNQSNLLRTLLNFTHQCLVTIKRDLYSFENCEEAICRHPELSKLLIDLFQSKFHPKNVDLDFHKKSSEHFLELIERLDTGNNINDERRKKVLKTALNFIKYTLKTNFYQNNKTAHAFRLDPYYLECIDDNYKEKYEKLPWGIFFISSDFFTSFHIRFKDLSRGGIRTIIPQTHEKFYHENTLVFTECFNLALTQHKKNKDIPEGGAKGVILLKPFDKGSLEISILRNEMEIAGYSQKFIEEILENYEKNQQLEHLYACQRSFIRNLLILVNADENGQLKAKNIIDYLKKPENLYLGPDENMHDNMIEWIAQYSKDQGYRPKTAFISGKPLLGINHKECGVTSLGLNVYMEKVLKYIGIDPLIDCFSVKLSGGPDGDVAGNQIENLYKYYKNKAKVVAITDVSGTVYDPNGLDLEDLHLLFKEVKPISFYPVSKLSKGAFLLNLQKKKNEGPYSELTLCTKNNGETLIEEWLSGNEMNLLYKTNVHQVKADVFIPAGGRPRTINENNYNELLDSQGRPNVKAIIEGANLYFSPKSRKLLEDTGILIIKDSSANKTGVICSSFEVLAVLTLGEKFLEVKEKLIKDILDILKEKAQIEADLLLRLHAKTNMCLTTLSDLISNEINFLFDKLLNYLLGLDLDEEKNKKLKTLIFRYIPKLISKKFRNEFEENIPENHKKAIIACYISSWLVYNKGIDWQPSIIELLPTILREIFEV